MRLMSVFLILAGALFSSYASAEAVWSGGAGVRHMIRRLDDGLNTTNSAGRDTSISMNRRWEYRAAVGVGGKGERVDWGIDLRTQPTTAVTSEWISNQQGNDFGIGLAQGFGRFHDSILSLDFALTVGRAKTVMLYDNVSQQFFDNDVRWDGFGWNFRKGNFGLNAAQYVLGAVSQGTVRASTFSKTEASDNNPQQQSHFAMLYSVQPYAQFHLGEDVLQTLAVGWYVWDGTGANTSPPSGAGFFSNAIHGGSANSTAGVAVGNTNPVILDNSKQLQIFSETAFPNNVRLLAELVHNKKIYYGTRLTASNPATIADRDAWAVSIIWGKPKKAGDFAISYAYGEKGIGSVIGTFSNGDIPPDNKSHFFEGKYMVADGLSLGGKAQFHNEKAKLDGNGVAIPSPNAGREQTQQRFELMTQVQF